MESITLNCPVCGYEYTEIDAENPAAIAKESLSEARKIRNITCVGGISVGVIISVGYIIAKHGPDVIQTADSLGSLFDRYNEDSDSSPDNSEITCTDCGESYAIFDIDVEVTEEQE